MADNPQTEVEVKNDTGAPVPVSVIGATSTTPIGNVGDRLKVDSQSTAVTIAGLEKTYSATVLDLNVAANPTDILLVKGSSTKKVKISSIIFSGIQTNSSVIDIVLIRRTADNTGGTRASLTNVNRDSSDAASTTQLFSYTVNPSALGASIGVVRAVAALLPNKNSAGATSVGLFEFNNGTLKPIILNNANEYLSLNLNGVSVPGSSLNICVEWTEE